MNSEIDSKLPCWMQELFKLVEDAKKENQHKVSTRANKDERDADEDNR